MFKWALISFVIVPVLLGMLMATRRRGRASLVLLLTVLLVYDVSYLLLLYFLHHRWVG